MYAVWIRLKGKSTLSNSLRRYLQIRHLNSLAKFAPEEMMFVEKLLSLFGILELFRDKLGC